VVVVIRQYSVPVVTTLALLETHDGFPVKLTESKADVLPGVTTISDTSGGTCPYVGYAVGLAVGAAVGLGVGATVGVFGTPLEVVDFVVVVLGG
jgi:hypothetical protein